MGQNFYQHIDMEFDISKYCGLSTICFSSRESLANLFNRLSKPRSHSVIKRLTILWEVWEIICVFEIYFVCDILGMFLKRTFLSFKASVYAIPSIEYHIFSFINNISILLSL